MSAPSEQPKNPAKPGGLHGWESFWQFILGITGLIVSIGFLCAMAIQGRNGSSETAWGVVGWALIVFLLGAIGLGINRVALTLWDILIELREKRGK